MERRRTLSFTVEEVEALCQQAAEHAREDLEWTLRIEMARAGTIVEEASRLRHRLALLLPPERKPALAPRRTQQRVHA